MISRALTVMSDERLAQLAAKGSDPAFAVLYNRYSATLFAYCRSITRNVDDGWDALQNAMIKVLVAGADEEAFAREVVHEVVSDMQQLPTGLGAADVADRAAPAKLAAASAAASSPASSARGRETQTAPGKAAGTKVAVASPAALTSMPTWRSAEWSRSSGGG